MCGHHVCDKWGVGGNGVSWDCVGSMRCVCDFWR